MPKLKSTFDACVKNLKESKFRAYQDAHSLNSKNTRERIEYAVAYNYDEQYALINSLGESIDKGEETLEELKGLEERVQELKTCIDYIARTRSEDVSPTELLQASGVQDCVHYFALVSTTVLMKEKNTLEAVNTILTRNHEVLDKLCKHVTKEYGPCNLKNTGYTQDAAAATLSESAKSGEATALSDSDAQNQSPDSYIAITDATETIPQNDVLKHTV